MQIKKDVTTSESVGVIVARFQIHRLHEAHIDLIQTVLNKHQNVIIFLGLSPLKTTQNNPLDFESRRQMLAERFPKIHRVVYIKDNPSDKVWSDNLDEQIKDLIGPNQTAVLYGSRDSFINHYHGKHETIELIPESMVSGTELRRSIGRSVMNDEKFRAGVIHATHNQYPCAIPTVDIAIFNQDLSKLLLGRKSNENKFRFIGGFADPQSDSYEVDARREVYEETGMEIGELHYIGSAKIKDWRYHGETNQIKTLFFMAIYIFGPARASDDICEIKWFDIDSLTDDQIVDCHIPLLQMLKKHIQKEVSK